MEGTHHHHTMDLPRPSPFDVQQVQDFTARNNFANWLQIVTTVHNDHRSRPFGRSGLRGARQSALLQIALHAFVYTAPQRGEKIEVPIRVIRGTSPMRLAALTGGMLDPVDIGQSYCEFPMDRIVYNAFDFDGHYPKMDAIIPDSLALTDQLQDLPHEVQHNVRIRAHKGRDLVTILLPLPDGRTASIAYQRRPTHLIESISLGKGEHDKTEEELSTLFADRPNVSLQQVYEKLVSTHRMSENPDQVEPGDSTSGLSQEKGQQNSSEDAVESPSVLQSAWTRG
jgi:hypothetical protein